jgi:hypothetical protein
MRYVSGIYINRDVFPQEFVHRLVTTARKMKYCTILAITSSLFFALGHSVPAGETPDLHLNILQEDSVCCPSQLAPNSPRPAHICNGMPVDVIKLIFPQTGHFQPLAAE